MPRSRRRLRLALALVGGPLVAAMLLLLAELALRLLAPESTFAPPRYFERREQDGRALLVPSANPPMANARFWPTSIPVEKPAGTVRLLCLGDSTVHGHPFEPPAAFSDWLAARLPRLLPGKSFEVVNLGANGMGSEEVRDLAGELAPLRPDVVVVYVGHNEFLENGADAARRPLSHALARAGRRSWLVQAFRRWTARGAVAAAPAPSASKQLVDDEPFFRPEEIERGIARYRSNLEAIARAIAAMGARPLLCLPICDLLDTPPERSSFAATTSAADRARFRTALASLRERRLEVERRWLPVKDAAHGNDASAGEILVAAQADARTLLPELDALEHIDDSVAALAYERGRLLRVLFDDAAAHAALVRTRDLDGHPIRATGAMLEVVRSVASEAGAVLADPWPVFEKIVPGGIAGQDGAFVDYVHPSLVGQRLIAEAIVQALAQRGVLAASEQWRFDAEPPMREYMQSMGLSPAKLADSLARRGMFALGQGYLDPNAGDALRAAGDLFTTALSVEPECALAHAGRGALALVRGDGAAALVELDRAREIDPASLATLIDNYEKVAAVRQLFDRAGIVLRDGRFVRP